MLIRQQQKDAFTLIELSIVLAIIGVIAGGIMAGQALLKAASMRAVSADVSKYRNAVENFQQQFGALPGDLENAFDFFGADCGTDAAAPTGCNGNDNGRIEGATEGFRAWQHLQLSNILSQTFSGTVGSGCTQDVNVPRAPVGVAAGFGFAHNDALAYIASRPSYITLLVMGSNDSNLCTGAAISIDDAYQLDLKADDGIPTTGETVSMGGSCIAGSDFNYGQAGNVCAMGFTLN